MKRQPIITDCLSGDIKIGEILNKCADHRYSDRHVIYILESDQALV